ncbi:50S ribosomal protein L3 [Candidatus Shapirobacteria bacterium CG10_big_fil_rev_8_21_14_0_10_40_9]|uniref:Large ribosomal subunit protein uL3 n=1 Tax=Candidatus Shapirobacteria bacterium CG10_big_fil_rev_8_21_14_0_10_40_9 TaxID=1974888 RepID=A0A2M8L3A1_9BACT|nr:MAG: 50S ribosomal protein L3 [Candidatus Shapirobacteria bacterium CG10_big_fil_rev_8_21_14_0_10_40_9]
MINSILGIKLGQIQKFLSDGQRIPVTEIQAGPCFVVEVKPGAVQLGFGERKEKKTLKPILGHIKKAGLKVIPRFLREVSANQEEESSNLKVGDEIKVGDIFKPGDIVDVTGTSKGKGFTGVVKRWGFAGGPRTHGQSDRERAPGSIGSTTTPGRVLKGKKMAGRAGGEKVTIKNLKVIEVNPEKNLLLVKGLVPGAKNGFLMIKKTGNTEENKGE